MTGEFPTDTLAPWIVWQCRDPRGSKAEPRAGCRHVGFRATYLDIQRPRRFEARRRWNSET